jgi:hypothetical protein
VIDRAALKPFLEELSLTGPVEPFLVLADWLQDRGHRWGELIAMQCQAPADDQRRRTFSIASHGLLELLADELCPHDPLVGIAWKRGFVSVIAFADSNGPDWMGDELARLFERPATALCGELSFAGAHIDDDHVRALLRVKPALERIPKLDLQGNWFSRSVVAALQHAFPRALLANQREGDEPADRGTFVKSWASPSIDE